jgi:hypothetical protein
MSRYCRCFPLRGVRPRSSKATLILVRGRAQLVGDRGQKVVFEAVELLQICYLAGQLSSALLHLGFQFLVKLL